MTGLGSWQRRLQQVLERPPFSAWGSRELASGSPAVFNMAAAAVRSLSRTAWGLALPAVLAVADYGKYSLLQTTAAVISQVGVLGTPQTLLRQPGRMLPIAGLFLHSTLIACLVLPLIWLRAGVEDRTYAMLVAAMSVVLIAYGILAARAKAASAFAGVLRVETIGAVALLLALGGLFWLQGWRGSHATGYATVAVLEIGATFVVVIGLLVARGTRVRREELTLSGTLPVLRSVYSVGFLVLLDLLIFRRLEMYFLEASPDGLQGVAVFGLGAQFANLCLLFPAAMVEAWMPGLATSFESGWPDFAARLRSNRRAYVRTFGLMVVAAIAGPLLLVPLCFTRYSPWTWYVAAFATIRVVCSYAGFYSSALYVTQRERALYVPGLLGVLVGIGSNAVLTLRWGVRGAVAAFAVTQAVVAIASLAAFRGATRTPRRERGEDRPLGRA